MRRFWYEVTAAMVILTAGWLWGVRHQLGVATPASRWVYDAYQYKTTIADAIKVPRVLIVAGSNALFGIDSAQLEAYWHKPVINLGVNAGLGLPYILDVSRRIARAGDTILMPLEYALYLDDGKPNAQIIDYVIARDLDYWRRLSRTEQLLFAAGMGPERWVQGLRQPADAPVTSGTYGAHHLNARGDQTHSAATDRSAGDIAAVQAVKPWDYGYRARKETGGWNIVQHYADWAHANHICLIAIPTALLHHARYNTDPDDRSFYSHLPQRLEQMGVPFLGKPADMMYPSQWFFDTDHHLQDWARSRHTGNVIALLEKQQSQLCHPN